MPATQSLKIVPFGHNTWHCDEGQKIYRIRKNGSTYACSCNYSGEECGHIRHLLSGQTNTPSNPELTLTAEQLQLAALEQKVQRLRLELAQVLQLGFVSDRQYVFIDSKYGGCWYTLDRNDQPQPIESTMLNGYIREIEFKTSGEGKKTSCKLLISVDADRRYILRTGHTTQFAKGMLATLAAMDPEQIARPVRINPQAAKETILCNLHQDGKLIRCWYGDHTDWRATAIQAKQNLAIARTL